MRTFRILVALVMALVSVSLSSCSKDDETNPIDNPLDINLLYGSWGLEYKYNDERCVLTFNTDKTWSETVYYVNDKQKESYGGTYTYNSENEELTIIGPYNEGGDIETRVWLILVLNKTRFTYLENNEDNGGVAYTRMK